MARRMETYPQRVLRKIRVDGRTTKQIMRDVGTLVMRDMPSEDQAKELVAELDRLINRQYRMAVGGAPVEMMYRIADEVFVLERTLLEMLRMCTWPEE